MLDERLGLRRPPRVRLSAAVRSPFVTGLFRPVVFLPADIVEQLEPEQLEHVLLHELAHVRRRDVWLSAACAVVQILYWFHPLVWLANSRLATIREQCCDRSVARILKDSTEDYRHTLMCLARRLLDDPASGRIGFLSPESVILARLRLLEGGAGKVSRLRRPAVTAVMIVMLVALLPMARTADDGIESVAEIIERPPGCLQLRFLVLERLAEEQQEQQGGVR